MKKALIFNPYFDTLGGGEKYTAGVIQALESTGYQVSLAWKDVALIQNLHHRFGLSFKQAQVDPTAFDIIQSGTLLKKHHLLSGYDLVFWVSDGSVPSLFGKHNIVHFQVPFHQPGLKSFPNRLKWLTVQSVVCNSKFTKHVIDRTYGVDSQVIYPPCQLIDALPKEKIILAVGRFDGLLHNKRQDVLIEAFKKLNASGWQLVMAGGDMGQTDNLATLKQMATGLSVTWVVNQSFDVLKAYYGKATLFWHAAGFGIDEQVSPEKVEHFGIATVEAMSAGAVPLVFAAGGQKEVIINGETGYLWHSVEELVDLTRRLINAPAALHLQSQNAINQSRQFSLESFSHAFSKLLS